MPTCNFQRREWDSNPRWCDPNMFSRHAPSATRPSLLARGFYHKAPRYSIIATRAPKICCRISNSRISIIGFQMSWYNSRPMKYHIWTEGCQMNVADSQRVGSALEHLGYQLTGTIEEADVIVLNTCVVRQSAEDKAIGRVTSLRPLKDQNPNLVINLMGCMVGVRGAEKLRAKLP